MIEMTVAGVRIEFPSNSPIVLLQEAGGERYLPIWIGQSEAQAIAIGQQGLATPRPMTHDLLRNILDEMAVQVTGITITELRDGVFYAVIALQRNGSSYEISSRPSDAIALAVRARVPIYVDEAVMDKAAVTPEEEMEGEPAGEGEDRLSAFSDFVDSLNLDDLGGEQPPDEES